MMREVPAVHLSKLLVHATGGISVALGLLTLLGWHTHSVALVQLGPILGAMPYSEALSLLLSGVGLLALTAGWVRLATINGIVVTIIGSLTLGEYLLGVSPGIAQFLIPAIDPTPYLARMAPNSALAFALAGITLLIISRASRRDLLLLLAGPLGAIVLALGLVAIIGYLTGLKTYVWGYHASMSPQTAFGCVALGGGLIAFAWQAGATPLSTVQHRFAVLIGIGVLTVILCLWQALIASEEALVERHVDLAMANIQNEVMTQLQSRVLALMRMGKRWEVQGKPPQEVWEADAELYVSHHPGVQAVAWADPSLHVQWVVPRDAGNVVQGLDLGVDDRQRRALELARDSRRVTSTGTLALGPGHREFHVYVPIMAGADFDGLIAGVFGVPELFDAILANVALRYSIAVYEGREEIYGRYYPGRQYERQWSQETSVGLYGVTWRLRIWPTPTLLAESLSSLPEVVLVVGLFTGALLVLAIYLAQMAQRRATQADIANQALEHEVAEHKGTEALLASRIEQMEAVRAVTTEITRELDLSTLLRLITRRATDLVAGAQAGAVYLWEESSQVLIPHAWHGYGAWMQQVRIALGEGIVGTVAQRREGVYVTDYQHSPYAQPPGAHNFGATAIIAEPLLYRERLVGVIVLDNRDGSRVFAQEDRELLTFFAAQAAVAIENARLYEAVALRFTRLQTLTRLNQLVSSSLDTGKVLSEIARSAAMLMNAPVVSFWLADEATRTLEVQTFSDESIGADFPAPHVAYDQGGVGWVAAHRRPLNLADVFADDRFVGLDWWRTHRLSSFFGLPILHEDNLIAVLAMYGHQPFRFDPDDHSVLDSFVAQAAVAIRNARFFTEIQDRTAHLARLNAELQNEISERQRAEDALRASEERFRSVVQSANDAIVLADSQGHIIAWNQGAQAIFGYTEVDVLGRSLTMLMPQRYHSAHQQGLERSGQTGEVGLVGKTLEFHGLRRDGSEFPLEMSLATWRADGRLFFSGIIRDITERKQAEDQLQLQREALYQREKLAAMGSLLASVAHELNNPLSVVMMQADLLSVEFKDEVLAERIKEISQAADRCVHIVRNFLALARQNPPQRTSVALNTVVEEALALLAYTLRVDNIEIELHLARDLPPLWADPHQLHQVVVNLLTNAHQALRDASPPRRLTVTTRYDPVARLVTLAVADTGPGIPAALRDRIFEPFFTTKPPGVGTGLGLPFCKGIIEAHGGSINVESAPGQGALFRIALRVEATSPEVTPPAPPTALPAVESRTILVIDDEPGITNALAYLLGRDGHTVETAANGRLGLEKLQGRTYDLILCDLRMPELDGQGFYRELQRSYPALLQQVIFLTGDTLSSEAREFLEQLNLARLSKPFRASEVRQAIQQALHAR